MTQKNQTKNKQAETQSAPTTVKPLVIPGNLPALKLNMADRFYLAVTKRTRNNLVFVYTLGCVGKDYKYDMTASTEIAAFDNEIMAEIYYQTILELIDYEKKSIFSEKYELMVAFNDGLMKNFNAKKRGK